MKFPSRISAPFRFPLLALTTLGLIVFMGCKPEEIKINSDVSSEPHIVASSQIEASRYLTIITGCNDCHTDGYLMAEGKVPEEDWLTGSSLGWRGPWGTTYPPNLRLTVQAFTEEEWVMILHERTDLPPMPWMNLNKMSGEDAKAIYQYIKSLGPKGESVPDALNLDVEPETPYLSLEPLNLPE